MLKHSIHSILLISLLAGSAPAQDGGTVRFQAARGAASRPTDAAVREQFLSIERIARLPAGQRSAQVPKLYQEMFPPLVEIVSREAMASSVFPPEKALSPRDRSSPPRDGNYGEELETVVATMTPEQVADTIASTHGSPILRLVALKRLEYVLLQFHPDLDKLILNDLHSSEITVFRRACTAIKEMKLKEFLDDLTAILITGPGPKDADARKALSWMQSDPEAAKPFLVDVAQNPNQLPRYSDVLRVMLFHQPADPVLVKLVDSSDPQVRRSAAIVLEETDSNSAVDLVPKLTSNSDQEVRLCGYRMAFRMPDELLNTVRGSLIPALKSPSIEERLTVANGFAGKRDPIGAPVLLAAMKDPQLPTRLRGQVSISVNRLLQTRVPTRLDMSHWGPDSPQNAQVIAQFEQWIASQQK